MIRMFDEIQGKYVGQLHFSREQEHNSWKNELDSGKQGREEYWRIQ